jgi:hypothetical protein
MEREGNGHAPKSDGEIDMAKWYEAEDPVEVREASRQMIESKGAVMVASTFWPT